MKPITLFCVCSLMSMSAFGQCPAPPVTGTGQICGTQYVQGTNNRKVICPRSADKCSCEIRLSLLVCLQQPQYKDPAIEVYPGDTVVWISDYPKGAALPFWIKPFASVYDPTNQPECSKPHPHKPGPFADTFSNQAHDSIIELRQASTVHPGAESGQCYKHTLMQVDATQKETELDPHVIIGDANIFLPFNNKDKDKDNAEKSKVK